MSADSLNASSARRLPADDEGKSPLADRTYTKGDDNESCDRISQESPFLLSPAADTSAPEDSENVAGVSTLSKTTIPTDAKASKPSEIQCLSKATSIDSWCSNDTLFNVEDNFDDLVMDADVPLDAEREKEDDSKSSDTLTDNEDEKEDSHCSTYIVHDSKSRACETFSTDSITARGTYTKMKSETAEKESPAAHTKSDVNDSSTKNTQTKDLAYGSLVSNVASYSNCATELSSVTDHMWKCPRPELVRRSPINEDMVFVTPPKISERKEAVEASPQLPNDRSVKKMDSVEITCLSDSPTHENQCSMPEVSPPSASVINDSGYHLWNMANSVQSTPLLEPCQDEEADVIPMELPLSTNADPDFTLPSHLPNFQNFFYSAEVRRQDISPRDTDNPATSLILAGDTDTFRWSSTAIDDRTATYSEFEDSATRRDQAVSDQQQSSANTTEEFHIFENGIRNQPQDLSAVDNNNLQLKRECKSGEYPGNLTDAEKNPTSPSTNDNTNTVDTSALNTRLADSYVSSNSDLTRALIPQIIQTSADEDDNEQPHSIIVADSRSIDVSKVAENITDDSHTDDALRLYHTYDSHLKLKEKSTSVEQQNEVTDAPIVNGDAVKEVWSPTIHELADAASKMTPTSPVEFRITVIESVLEATDASNGHLEVKPENGSGDASVLLHNGNEANYATVNFINEPFEELLESNVDGQETDNSKMDSQQSSQKPADGLTVIQNLDACNEECNETATEHAGLNGEDPIVYKNGGAADEETRVKLVTRDFLQNEKISYQLDAYLPLLSDIRFTGKFSL